MVPLHYFRLYSNDWLFYNTLQITLLLFNSAHLVLHYRRRHYRAKEITVENLIADLYSHT